MCAKITIHGQLFWQCVQKILSTDTRQLSMKHLSNSTNEMNSPNFKAKIDCVLLVISGPSPVFAVISFQMYR